MHFRFSINALNRYQYYCKKKKSFSSLYFILILVKDPLHSNFHLFSMPQIEDFNATNCTSEFHELANLALLCLLIISINNFFLHNIHCNFKFHHQILDKTYDFLKVSFYQSTTQIANHIEIPLSLLYLIGNKNNDNNKFFT